MPDATFDRFKTWARRRVPPSARSTAADLGFLLEVLVARLSIDRHRSELRPGDIDAEALSRSYDVAVHAAKADEYFGAGLEDAPRRESMSAHLIKPFNDAVDAANHLAAFASLLGGLDVEPGMTVLDFGCGAGWTSRLLMQLGCRVVLCDVSRAALETAAAGFERHPPILHPGTPDPVFLPFDGHRIDLSDGSVDRVFCFDAFHHVPNHPEVIAEFGRVLGPDGIAGFHEPGPDHSRKVTSQFEMRAHGFLERDLLIGPIWDAAQRAGFERLSLSLVAPPLAGVEVRRYDRVLRSGAVPLALRRRYWHMAATTRIFYLSKGGVRVPDSRRADGLDARIRVLASDGAPVDGHVALRVRVENTGSNRWLRSDHGRGAVLLGAHRYDEQGDVVELDAGRFELPGDGLLPGEATELDISLPPVPPGQHYGLDLFSEGITWFSKRGATVCQVAAGPTSATR
jgi:SAM-dependent methyltransferase